MSKSNSLVYGPILYGVNPDKPKLPEGWRYIERAGEWLLAESPEGDKRYYVTLTGLYRQKVWPEGHYKAGQCYLDRREAIRLA